MKDLVRQHLETVLDSPPFRRVGGQAKLLRYIVEHTLDGDQDSLKEYLLGMDVFQRGQDFDPKADAVVRVEALRLRARLEKYYSGEGKSSPVVIELPRGGYVPTFHLREPAAPKSSGGRRAFPWIAAAVAGIVIVSAVYLGVRRPRSPGAGGNSLAVLPFLNLTGNPENQYVCDGFVEDLTTELSTIPALHVAARTSASAIRGRSVDVREIGRQLGVSAVLEGSLRQDDKDWVISAQLVDTSDGYHLWSQTYRGGREAVMAMEGNISTAVVRALRLPGAAAPSQTPQYVPGEAARELYWRGVSANAKGYTHRPESLRYWEQAVALEPKYVEAWARLANQLSIAALHREYGPAGLDRAKEAIRRTLELQDTNALAHAGRAVILYGCEWNWAEAESEFRRAIALDPSDPAPHLYFFSELNILGRYDEALREFDRAGELDPLHYRYHEDRSEILFYARRHQEAIAAADRAIQADTRPESTGVARLNRGAALTASGRAAEAVETLRDSFAEIRLPMSLGRYGAALAAAGRREEARQVLRRLLAYRGNQALPNKWAGVSVTVAEMVLAAPVIADIANRIAACVIFTGAPPLAEAFKAGLPFPPN